MPWCHSHWASDMALKFSSLLLHPQSLHSRYVWCHSIYCLLSSAAFLLCLSIATLRSLLFCTSIWSTEYCAQAFSSCASASWIRFWFCLSCSADLAAILAASSHKSQYCFEIVLIVSRYCACAIDTLRSSSSAGLGSSVFLRRCDAFWTVLDRSL